MKYDTTQMQQMADDFERYLDIVDKYIIIEGITKDQYKEARKKIKKLIKHLRNGDGDKVFDKDAYREFMQNQRRL